MSKDDCKSPNVWVTGTIKPYKKGYCTTVKEILNIEKSKCTQPNIWVPGTKQPFKKGHCVVPNLKIDEIDELTDFTSVFKQQLDYLQQLDKKKKDAIQNVLLKDVEYIADIVSGKKEPTGEIIENIKTVDEIFTHIPALAKPVIVYKNVQELKNKLFNIEFIYFSTMYYFKPNIEKYQIHLTLPTGSKIIPMINYGTFQIILPRYSVLEVGKYDDKIINHRLKLPQKLPVIKDEQDIEKILKPQMDYMDNLDDNVNSALTFIFKTSSQNYVNDILDGKEQMNDYFAKNLVLVDSIFKMAPKLSETITVYKNVNELVDSDVVVTSFTTTSLVKPQIEKYQLQITIPKGTRIILHKLFGKLSIILPRETNMNIYKMVDKISYMDVTLPQKLPLFEKKDILMDVLKPQLDFIKTLTKEEQEAFNFVIDKKNKPLLNKIASGEIDADSKIGEYIKLVDYLFTIVPKLKDDVIAYQHSHGEKTSDTYITLSYINFYTSLKSKKDWIIEISIKKGSLVLPYYNSKGQLKMLSPRNDMVTIVDKDVGKKILKAVYTTRNIKNIPIIPYFSSKFQKQISFMKKVKDYDVLEDAFDSVPPIEYTLEVYTENFNDLNKNNMKIPKKILDIDSGKYVKIKIPIGSKVLIDEKNGIVTFPKQSVFEKIDKYIYIFKQPQPTSPQLELSKQQKFMDKLTQEQKKSLSVILTNYTPVNSMNNITNFAISTKEYIKNVDKIFKSIPPLDKKIEAYVFYVEPNVFKKFVNSYRWAMLDIPEKKSIKINIPSGSHIVPLNDKKILFPRGSELKYKEDGVYDYIIPPELPEYKIVAPPPQEQYPHKTLHPKSAIYVDKDYNKLLQPQIEYMKNLNIKTVQALKFYTGNGYMSINSFLNKGNDTTNKVKEYINLIDDAFKNAPPITQTFVVYRGIKHSSKITSDFVNKPYFSTSSNKAVSLGFSGNKNYKCCFFEVTVPKGSKVLPIMNLSLHSHEWEILLPRSSEFHVVKHSFTPKENTVIVKYVDTLAKLEPFTITEPEKPPKKTNTTGGGGVSGGKTCPPNPKYSPSKYICNPASGKWVLKTGDIGKKLLKSLNSGN